MKLKQIVIVFFVLFLWGCKSDKPVDNQDDIKINKEILPSENKSLLKGIDYAYNTKKFKAESYVKFNIDLKVADTLFFSGYVTLKTDASKIKIYGSKIDKILTPNQLNSDFDKVMYLIAESYALPFWIKPKDFRKLEENDSLIVSHYKSDLSPFAYEIATHPQTNIIQKIEYQTGIKTKPFKKGLLYFDRYITVNRVPVAMQWRIEVDGEIVATAEISRISYPEVF